MNQRIKQIHFLFQKEQKKLSKANSAERIENEKPKDLTNDELSALMNRAGKRGKLLPKNQSIIDQIISTREQLVSGNNGGSIDDLAVCQESYKLIFMEHAIRDMGDVKILSADEIARGAKIWHEEQEKGMQEWADSPENPLNISYSDALDTIEKNVLSGGVTNDIYDLYKKAWNDGSLGLKEKLEIFERLEKLMVMTHDKTDMTRARSELEIYAKMKPAPTLCVDYNELKKYAEDFIAAIEA